MTYRRGFPSLGDHNSALPCLYASQRHLHMPDLTVCHNVCCHICLLVKAGKALGVYVCVTGHLTHPFCSLIVRKYLHWLANGIRCVADTAWQTSMQICMAAVWTPRTCQACMFRQHCRGSAAVSILPCQFKCQQQCTGAEKHSIVRMTETAGTFLSSNRSNLAVHCVHGQIG